MGEIGEFVIGDAREQLCEFAEGALLRVGREEGGLDPEDAGQLQQHRDCQGTLIVLKLVEVAGGDAEFARHLDLGETAVRAKCVNPCPRIMLGQTGCLQKNGRELSFYRVYKKRGITTQFYATLIMTHATL